MAQATLRRLLWRQNRTKVGLKPGGVQRVYAFTDGAKSNQGGIETIGYQGGYGLTELAKIEPRWD